MNLRKALCIVIVLSLSSGLALAKKDAPTSAPASSPTSKPEFKLPTYWAIMDSVVTFTPDQRDKVKELILAGRPQRQPLEAKIKDAQAKYDAAKAAGNKEDMNAAQATKSDLQKQLDATKAKMMTQVLALLTPQQKELWATYSLVLNAKQHMAKRVELTEAQETKIKEMAKQETPKLLAAKDDKAAIDQVQADFFKQVKADVLTDDQRKALESKHRHDDEKAPTSAPAGAK